jgi:hypothetical protein
VPVKPVLATPICFVNAGKIVVVPAPVEHGKVTVADNVTVPSVILVSVIGFTFVAELLTMPAGVIDH